MRKTYLYQFIVYLILYTIIAVAFSSCSSQRCNYHNKRAKALGCLTDHSDTIWHTDTIRGFSVDTVFKFTDSSAVDTVWIVSNGAKVQTVIKWKEKLVEQTITKKDTVIKTLQITKYKNFEVEVNKIPWWIKLAMVVMGIVITLLAFKK